MKKLLLAPFVCLLFPAAVRPQVVGLVRDITPPGYFSSTLPSRFHAGDSLMHFIADDSVNGGELWVTDGSTAGTVLVKDIYPGTLPGSPGPFIEAGGEVFFSAVTPGEGGELWKTDGTGPGTTLVKDIDPGSGYSYPMSFIDFNGALLFRAYSAGTGTEPWISDGTTGGTSILADITPGPAGGFNGFLGVMGGYAFFTYSDTNGAELWKTDGTPGGAAMVKDIEPGPDGSQIQWARALDTVLLFAAYDSAHGRELWRSDGTPGGTVLVRDIRPGIFSSDPGLFSLDPLSASVIDGVLYFGARDSAAGRELWKSDGTTGGTVLVKDINPGSGSSNPYALAGLGGGFVFSAEGTVSNRELWISDGTGAGTALLKEIYPGTAGSSPFFPCRLGSKVYFAASDSAAGRELWSTDGTPSGTKLVTDLSPGTDGSYPQELTIFKDTLYFTAWEPTHGYELRKLAFAGDSAWLSIQDRWNLVSLPVAPFEASKDSVFPTSTGDASGWNGSSYETADPLETGRGYFIRFPGGQSVGLFGAPLTADTLDVGAGWNLIGSLSTPVPVASIASEPGGIVTSHFFGYDGSYFSADTLQAGGGYWVKAFTPGQLILSAAPSLAPSARIRISETVEAPPPPPPAGAGDGDAGGLAPGAYALRQNYPNPFNPSTTIGYDLPAPGKVRLVVYDLLGREVMTLVDRVEAAGRYAVGFEASELPSGMYYYRLTTGGFTGTGKMLLMK